LALLIGTFILSYLTPYVKQLAWRLLRKIKVLKYAVRRLELLQNWPFLQTNNKGKTEELFF
jgi:hypothetical protein